jgi:uracil-DNA glycosylase
MEGTLIGIWKERLQAAIQSDEMVKLRSFLSAEKSAGSTIYPPMPLLFNALNWTPFERVRVVIIGQDPYHGEGQAHGLSFSVPRGIDIPPSLRNIYKEIHADLGKPIPSHGCLQHWAEQGVLLLNSVLTVRAHEAASHRNRGWEGFTDRIISILGTRPEPTVFMLWGAFAQSKSVLIDARNHLILQAPHPSPLSAHRGFLGCRHFSKANDWLQAGGIEPIDWTVPN